MQDRIPQHSNRFKLIPVASEENVFDLERADGATQKGTPLNKSTLLSDETARMFGMEENSPMVTPDAVFKNLHKRTTWAKVVDEKFNGGVNTIDVTLPSSLTNFSELLILLYGGDYSGGSYTNIPVDVSIVTSENREIAIDIDYIAVSKEKNYNKIAKLDLIGLNGGICIVKEYVQNEEHGNFMDTDEVLSSIVFEITDNQKFFENANVIIFAR